MVKIPPIDKVYGVSINTKIYGKECLDLYSKDNFIIGSIPHRNPYLIWTTIRDKLIEELGEEEWLNRAKVLHDKRIERRRLHDNQK